MGRRSVVVPLLPLCHGADRGLLLTPEGSEVRGGVSGETLNV